MLAKLFIVVVMLAILASLASALYHLLSANSSSRRTARALSLRIILAFALFAVLLLGYALGVTQPHAL